MKNGYFLEGFVFFKDAKTQKDLVSLPYIGFKGHYQDHLPGIESQFINLLVRKNLSITIKMRKRKIQSRIRKSFYCLVSSIRRDGKKSRLYWVKLDGKYDGNALVFSPNGEMGI